MHKKIYVLLLLFASLLMLSFSANALDISAKGAVLLEMQSGDVVYGKNADARLPMASTTKIMTAIVVIENAELDDTVVIEPCMTNVEGSSIYLHEGECLKISDLLYALLLESANDASVALAYTVGGSIEGFAQMMNDKAAELGLSNTHFTNPHGLDDCEHYTTPYELGLISVYAMKNPVFAEIVSTYKKEIPLNNGEGSRVLVNHNKLLRSYDGAIGIKTGFTKKCGRCLVSCAERDGVMLVCVTLNAPNDWNDHKNMLDLGFNKYTSINLTENYDYTVRLNSIGGNKESFLAKSDGKLSITLEKNNVNISAVFEANRLISAPVSVGDVVGRIVFYNNGTEIGSLPVKAIENVKAINYKKSFFERLFK
ncbi:MAG: D-alanyl-D-alanine carboxypeptidase [Clostridia bacterium]|nr:D-alanyl-D-alanine carboxypeptidase [Clostridia bacterium]